ncbi:MoaD/ThiS family protein [Pontibacter silvestris]|uniref:MoaD/ThiS family protein n=1 Tax=Pontibacter silvestris TaxID=2305183 RepID=A0ABW4X0Z4_9BACT|nr:MoaD/ThiS family protein [Pontibacter silvestris]MCC9137478.1 MoaD/ThiS family protein [Pontibacter silvestris]
MKVQVFAALKDYFDKEFELKEDVDNVTELRQYLTELNTSAGNMLKTCRFAIDDEFVDQNYQLKENDTISVIPPSSGG